MRAPFQPLGLAVVGLILVGSTSRTIATEPKLESVENTLGMNLILIPAGEFTMGDRSAPKIRPLRQVRIEKPFYLGTTEVTIAQYGKFVEATQYKGDAEKGEGGFGWSGLRFARGPNYTWNHSGDGDTGDMPVANISWNDTRAFCDWLSKREEKTYRLPTEAEWEYACRAGTTTAYSFGDDPEGLAKVGNGADLAYVAKFPPEMPDVQPDYNIQASDGYIFRAPVGKFQANPWGLFDMHGNLWEWCGDLFRYSGAKTGTVRRGGSWRDGPPFTTSAFRMGGEPLDYAHDMTGFRVARDVAGQ